MDVREKLVEEKVELSDVICYAIRDWDDYMDECRETETPPIDSFEDFIADGVISAGYRKQEWISVKDRLPEHGDVVLCFMKFGEQRILQWDNVSNWWLGYGHGDDWQKADVTHWCCLPQPPKGE